MASILIDTNVLVYAHDRGEFAKQRQAIRILDALHESGNGRLSTQTLAEFFRAVTKGKQPILTGQQARLQIEQFARIWTVHEITAEIVVEAVRGVVAHQFSYWDAQIWATARLNQISVIFSEDFNVGAVLGGVRLVNPFAEGFAVEEWI